MPEKVDFKRVYKGLYLPGNKPEIVDVPEMKFIMVDGTGDPNTAAGYKNALEILYALSYSIKMSKMSGATPEGYYDYVVPPLEGLWWSDDGGFDGVNVTDKSKLRWTSIIRQPDFVTNEVFDAEKNLQSKKKPNIDFSAACFESYTEGLCVQIMHIGSYDDEPASIDVMKRFIAAEGYIENLSEARRHHEIYVGDPRKTAPDKLKTVIRHPIVKAK